MFESIFESKLGAAGSVAVVAAVALAAGLAYSFALSLRLRTSKGFFITTSLMPLIVSLVISVMGVSLSGATSTTARIVTIAVALGLIRFRSNNGKAEEMLLLFGTIAIGLICGLGYLAFAFLLAVAIAAVYLALSALPVFTGKRFAKEKTLKITIPESLNYDDAFTDIFGRFLKQCELTGVKTTGMGSMYKLTYRVIMKDPKAEKAFIDELRVRNGNLEIGMLPFVEDGDRL